MLLQEISFLNRCVSVVVICGQLLHFVHTYASWLLQECFCFCTYFQAFFKLFDVCWAFPLSSFWKHSSKTSEDLPVYLRHWISDSCLDEEGTICLRAAGIQVGGKTIQSYKPK